MSDPWCNLPAMDVTETTRRAGRKRSKPPGSKRTRDLLRFMDEKGWTILGLSRMSGLSRGTVQLFVYTDDTSRQSAATLDAMRAAGIPEPLLRAG